MVLADALSRASVKDANPEISEEKLAAQIHMVYSNDEVTVQISKKSEDRQQMIACYQNLVRKFKMVGQAEEIK